MTYYSCFLVSLIRAKLQGACYVETRGEPLTRLERLLLWLSGIELGRQLVEVAR